MLNNNKRGFSFIEILLAIGMIALITAAVVGLAAKTTKSSNETINGNTPVMNHANQSCGINDVLKAGCEGKVVVGDARK